MCKVSEKNIHWFWRYASERTIFFNLSKQNGNKAAILDLILTTLPMIHGRIVVNACVKYRKKIFIGVGDIHPEGQNFQILCQFEQTKCDKWEFDPYDTSQDPWEDCS